MKKIFSFCVFSLLSFLVIFYFGREIVLADGMIMKPDPYSDRWDYSGESNQQAFINYDNGLQKMIISIGLEEESSGGVVWVFPVPSDPNQVAIDVVKDLPNLNGEEISGKAKSNLENTKDPLLATQLYTIPFISLLSGSSRSIGGSLPVAGSLEDSGKNISQDIQVYEHLEKEGIISEIITAKTASGLYNYLKNKGLKIENGTIPVFDNYIGKEYSFIVSWIDLSEKIISREEIENNLQIYFANPSHYPKFFDLVSNLKGKYPEFNKASNWSNYLRSPQGEVVFQELIQGIQNDPSIIVDVYNREQVKNSNQRGLFVMFQTKEIYFPLLPTSVYGSKVVPATIRVMGYVSPKVFQNIKGFTTTKYYLDRYVDVTDDLENFYTDKKKEIKYTKIEINSPSKFLTQDLWISDQTPAKVYFSSFVAEHPIFDAIALLVLSSITAGIFAGIIVFKDLRKKPIKLALIGLSNLATLFGVLITIALVGTKNKDENLKPLLSEIKKKGYFGRRRFARILFFLATPFLIFGIMFLGVLMNEANFIHSTYRLITELLTPIFIFYILPILALIVAFLIKRVKTEDKNLFEQLKLAGYSSWSFEPRDGMKYVFIPLFSVSFLIISLLLIKLIKFIV